MLKEMLDLLQAQIVQVFRLLPVRIDRQHFINRHGQYFGVLAAVIFHLQHTDRTAAHDNAGNQRERGDDEHVNRIAIAGDGMRHVTVVAWVMHGGAHEAVYKNCAGFFVDFILDRIGIHRDFDDNIKIVRQVTAGWYFVQAHQVLSRDNKKIKRRIITVQACR